MITVYCPECWQEIPEGGTRCPFCGFELGQDRGRSFEQKLLRTLEHPVHEKRLLAIQILGSLECQAALPAFEKILTTPEADVHELRETLIALSRIPSPRSRELLQAACQHPYPVIRRQAESLLREYNERGADPAAQGISG